MRPSACEAAAATTAWSAIDLVGSRRYRSSSVSRSLIVGSTISSRATDDPPREITDPALTLLARRDLLLPMPLDMTQLRQQPDIIRGRLHPSFAIDHSQLRIDVADRRGKIARDMKQHVAACKQEAIEQHLLAEPDAGCRVVMVQLSRLQGRCSHDAGL